MTDAAPNRIAHFRRMRKLSQQQLADLVGGVHWITISKLERGKIKLTEDWLQKIASALDCDPIDLFANRISKRRIYIDGIVFPGGEVGYEKEKQQEAYQDLYLDVGNSTPGFWFVVLSDSFFPILREGDIIRTTINEGITIQECMGRLCHITIDTKGINQYVAFLEPGSKPDLYTLRRGSSPAIKDVPVLNVDLVTMAIFQPSSIADFGQ